MARMKGENVCLAEKIALFDCEVWPKWRTNDKIANQQRMLGNKYYESLQFEKAIAAYNECLCFSSCLEERGIAYSNRSAAYFALNSYQDCIESIRLAKECPLPANIKKKVLAREQLAVVSLETDEVRSGAMDEPPVKLSYSRSKYMPSFASCLDLQKSRNLYDGIVTTEFVCPGDVLVVGPPFMRNTKMDGICDYCFRVCGSLQPCSCGPIMFCSAMCKDTAFKEYHKYECPLMDHLNVFPYLDCLVLRVFLKLIQRFEDVASLREYLESIKNTNPFGDETWSNLPCFDAEFRLYYGIERPSLANCAVRKDKLFRTGVGNKNMNVCMAKTAIIIDMLKTCKQIPRIAKNEEEWSFLTEQLFRLMFYKPFATITIPIIEFKFDINKIPVEKIHGQPVFLFQGSGSLFRTSCQPNVEINYEQNNVVVRALENISPGTELLAPNE